MIDTLRNYPSIVMWVPFNEGWGQHDTPEVVAWLQKYDPSRPVNEASGWHDRGSGDVSDMHNYPGPGMRPVGVGPRRRARRIRRPGHADQGTHLDRREELGLRVVRVERRADRCLRRPADGRCVRSSVAGLSAAVYTQTSDVEIEVNGLMTYDREAGEDGRGSDHEGNASASTVRRPRCARSCPRRLQAAG